MSFIPFLAGTLGGVNLGAGQAFNAASGDLSITSDVTLFAVTLTVSGSHNTAISGVIDEFTGAGSLIKSGSGTLTLSGVNCYTGGTSISGGITAISNDNNLGATTGGVTFSNNAILQTTAGVTFAAARTFTINATGGTIDTNNQASTLNGTISGAGVLNVVNSSGTGFGVLTVTADNSAGFTGGFVVGDASDHNVTLAVSKDNNLGARRLRPRFRTMARWK